jgi:hypothetical protein
MDPEIEDQEEDLGDLLLEVLLHVLGWISPVTTTHLRGVISKDTTTRMETTQTLIDGLV